MSAQPNEFDPQDRNPAARLHEMDRLHLLRQPGAGTRMAERLKQAEATGNYHEFTTPKTAGDSRHDEPACCLPHPFQTFAVEGDTDGYCADCRSQAEAIRPKSLEERKRLHSRRRELRRQWILDTFGMPLPEWLYSLVLIVSTTAWITWFAWGVGR